MSSVLVLLSAMSLSTSAPDRLVSFACNTSNNSSNSELSAIDASNAVILLDSAPEPRVRKTGPTLAEKRAAREVSRAQMAHASRFFAAVSSLDAARVERLLRDPAFRATAVVSRARSILEALDAPEHDESAALIASLLARASSPVSLP